MVSVRCTIGLQADTGSMGTQHAAVSFTCCTCVQNVRVDFLKAIWLIALCGQKYVDS